MKIGYTTGVWDLFHVGHLRLLQNASNLCDVLIVGVSTDELVEEIKKRKPIMPFEDRMEIIKGLSCVDVVVPQHDYNKKHALEKLNFDILFVGDDHYEENVWQDYERTMDVEIVYLPYTQKVSTTSLIKRIYDRV